MIDGLRPEVETPREGRFSFGDAAIGFGLAAFAASWLITLHIPPWVSWHAEVLSFLAVFSLAWLAVARTWSKDRSHAVDVPFLAVPLALFGLVALVQLATGLVMFWGDVLVVWLYVSLCIACLVLGFNACAQDGFRHGPAMSSPAAGLLATTLVGIALVSTVIAFAQVFALWEESGWIVLMLELRRPGGNIAQPNQLGTLLVMGLASIAFLHVSGRIGALAAVLVLLVLCAGIAATESRSAALAVAALLVWWQLKRRGIAPRVSPWAAPLLGAIFVLMFTAYPKLMNLMQVFSGQVDNRFTPSDVRWAVWTQLLEAVWQRPWFGWGILEVAEAQNAVAHVLPGSNAFTYSHNLVIDWAVWMGLPIALGLVVATGVWLWRRLKLCNGPLTWYCLAVALPLATHSMVEFPFAYAYFLAPVMFLLGVLERSVGAKSVLRLGPLTVAAMLVSLSAVLTWSAFEYLSIEDDFRVVRFEALNLGKTPADHHRPNVILLTQLGAVLNGSRIELRPGMPPEDLAALRKLALRYPWVATEFRYAIALALNGDQPEAIRQLQVLRSLRGEKTYAQVKAEFAEQAETRYPQLRTLPLP